MNSESSITAWIGGVKGGDEYALQKIWNRYLTRLYAIADGKLRETHKHFGGADDAVSEAMTSFFFRVKNGEFPRLNDRNDLWPLLITITKNKATDFVRKENANKRPRLVNPNSKSDEDTFFVEQILGKSPTPDDLIAAKENAARLLSYLRNDYQETARLKLEGRTNADIAKIQGLMERAVERRIALVRATWIKQFVVEKFCDAWESGAVPNIHEYYSECADDFSTAPPIAKERVDLLLKLAKKDLAFRWRNWSSGSSANRVETKAAKHYIQSFPDLSDEKKTLELLCHEFLVRHEFGDRPGQQEFINQNATDDHQLRKRLADRLSVPNRGC